MEVALARASDHPDGLEGFVVLDEQKRPHVYVLTQEASPSYEKLTTHDRMPFLVGQEL